MTIKQLRQKLGTLNAEEMSLRKEARDTLSSARAEGSLTDAQRQRHAEITQRLAAIETERGETQSEIANLERLAQLERDSGLGSAPVVTDVREAADSDPMRGFKTPREYIGAVIEASRRPNSVDPRLRPLATAGSDEHSTFSDPHGGYFVPEAMQPETLRVDPEVDPTDSRVRRIPMSAPTVSFRARVDKDHSTSVSGGLTVSRRDESGTGTASRMKHEKVTLKANSQFGVAYETEELLQDSPVSFAALIEAGFADEFASATFDERINGTGVGEYLGILNAPCTIVVSKEGGQAADTIVGANIKKMRSRAWRYSNGIWLANHDTQDQLTEAHLTLTNDDVKLFAPGNGTDRPDTLYGRPIFFTEYVKTVGDKGDLILADFSQYLEGEYQALGNEQSMHVRFLQHERTFKFFRRNDGQPWWRSALTPKNGANTLSPFVVLAARA